MALRWPLDVHFEFFWALVAKWFSDYLWRLILSYSGLWWPNSSQMPPDAIRVVTLVAPGPQMRLGS